MGNVITHDTTDPDKEKRRRSAQAIARKRRKQLQRLFDHRFEGRPCQDEQAETFLFEMLIQIWLSLKLKTAYMVADKWRAKYTPDIPRSYIVNQMSEFRLRPPFYASSDIGRRIKLLNVERRALKITHIAATDLCDDEKHKEKLADHAAASSRCRLKKPGAKTRAQAKCNTRPRLPGEKPATYYRRLKREDAQAALA